jgi:general secretion pathway protein C
MQTSSVSNRAAFEQRLAQAEQLGHRALGRLKLISLVRWQALIMLLLVLWLSHTLARLFWLVMPLPVIPPASTDQLTISQPASMPAGANKVNIDQLKDLTPFGDNKVVVAEAPVETVAPTVEENAADTQLNLILRGVVSSNVEAAGRALITVNDKEDVFAVGDTLPIGSNVTLAKVLPDRVILSNNGRFETLWLFKEDPNAPKLATAYSAPPPSNDWPRGPPSDSPYQQAPAQAYRSPDMASPVRAADPAVAQSLADVVAMSIYREEGKVVGYKIRPGRNADQFFALGLQADDVVMAVNGVPLSSPGKIMEIYKTMGSATSANLEIKRGGGTVNLDVVLK